MPSAETVLTKAALTGDIVVVPAPGLRHGDIESGTSVTTVGGFVQDQVTYAVDYAGELIQVRNDGPDPWMAGARLVISWQGVPLEDTVKDHETRITALEAGGGGSGGGAANHFTSPVYFEGDSSSDYGIYIDSPDKDYGAGILANLGGVRRWEVMLGDGSPETMGTNQGNDLTIGRYSDYNQYMDEPLRIDRKSGSVVIKIPECADSAAAGAAGIPIGGLYHVSGAVKVRLY